MLDWELCTLGDPLADVGYLGVYWTDDGGPPRGPTTRRRRAASPRYAELLERYANATGRDLSDIEYYRAFAAFRLAVISEGVYARYLHGVMADEDVDVETFKAGVDMTPRWPLDSSTACSRTIRPGDRHVGSGEMAPPTLSPSAPSWRPRRTATRRRSRSCGGR